MRQKRRFGTRRRSAVSALAAAFAASCRVAPAWAQLPDLVDLSAQYMPSVELDEPKPLAAQVSSYDASVNVPLELGPRSFLIPGFAYHLESVSFSNIPAGFAELRSFHALELAFLYVQPLAEQWSLSFRFAPGLAGDFRDLDSGMLRVSALALATHTFSEQLLLGGGALADFSFGTLLPLPAAYLEWKPFQHFQLEAFLPAFVSVQYTLWERLELGARVRVAGNSYAVRDERIRGAWPCRAEPSDDPTTAFDESRADARQCMDHIAYSVGTVAPFMALRVVESLWWNIQAGHSIFRRFEQRSAADERIRGGLDDLPNTAFVQSGLTWRLPQG
jgi:hypothetical protein